MDRSPHGTFILDVLHKIRPKGSRWYPKILNSRSSNYVLWYVICGKREISREGGGFVLDYMKFCVWILKCLMVRHYREAQFQLSMSYIAFSLWITKTILFVTAIFVWPWTGIQKSDRVYTRVREAFGWFSEQKILWPSALKTWKVIWDWASVGSSCRIFFSEHQVHVSVVKTWIRKLYFKVKRKF